MPANLPPQYFEAEKKLRAAKTNAEKIMILEELLAIMPHHKGTDKLRADLRRRIAKLTEAADRKLATQRASMLIEKEGAAQIVLIGQPNAGKSQLVTAVTNASPTVAEYPYTTLKPMPGMMEFENIQIQLIDTPPLTRQTIEWWLVNTVRRADALLIVIDLSDDPIAQMEAVTAQMERMKVGLGNTTEEDSEVSLTPKKALVVGNKMDMAGARENYQTLTESYGDQLTAVSISAREGLGLEELKLKIYEVLDIIRVYTKAPGKPPELTEPIVLKSESTLEEAAAEVHKDFAKKLKYARIWGSGKHDGIMAKRDHILKDGDIIELHV